VQLHAISWFWFCLLRGAQGAREDADIFEKIFFGGYLTWIMFYFKTDFFMLFRHIFFYKQMLFIHRKIRLMK
jgi:hypothetical protein